VHLHTSSEPRERQEEDLQKVGKMLRKDFPQLQLELYFAAWDGKPQGKIDFIPLAE
jgi:hypothetical protein